MPIYYSAMDSRNYRLELEIVESSQDIANNTTTISYWLFLRALGSWHFQDFASTIALTIDGVSLLNTTTQRVSLPGANSATLLTSGTRVINHATDGTKSLPFSASFRTNSTTTFTPIPTHTINDSMVLTTIPRASQPTLNVSTQALGSAITISTNRASTAFTHIIKYTFGNQSGTIATGVEASHSWILPLSLANAIPNTTSGSGTIWCETYNGGVLIGTRTVAFTVTVPNNATFQPNASISSITEGQGGLTVFSVFIQNISRLRVQSTGSGNFGATISQWRVTIDGGHLFGADVTFNPINKSGSITVTLLVTDSRGYTRTVTQNVTLVAYFAPKINSFSASRSPNDQGTDLSAPVNFEIAPISNQNGRYYRVRYRVVGGSWVWLFESWDYYLHTHLVLATGVLNTNNSYEIELYVSDYFTHVTQTVTVTTAFDLVNYNASGKGIAFGKVSEGDTFEVDLPSQMHKGIAFIDSRDFSEQPQDIPERAISFTFKNRHTSGGPPISAENSYSHIINVAGWSTHEGSGGWPTQLSIGAGGIAVRQATSATTWGPWAEMNITENGTWTPVAQGTDFIGVGSYIVQKGKYTKIGRVVHYNIEIGWTAHTGTGAIDITLPFNNGDAFAPCSILTNKLNYSGQITPMVIIGSNILRLYTGAPNSDVNLVTMDNEATLYIIGSYMTL